MFFLLAAGNLNICLHEVRYLLLQPNTDWDLKFCFLCVPFAFAFVFFPFFLLFDLFFSGCFFVLQFSHFLRQKYSFVLWDLAGSGEHNFSLSPRSSHWWGWFCRHRALSLRSLPTFLPSPLLLPTFLPIPPFPSPPFTSSFAQLILPLSIPPRSSAGWGWF